MGMPPADIARPIKALAGMIQGLPKPAAMSVDGSFANSGNAQT